MEKIGIGRPEFSRLNMKYGRLLGTWDYRCGNGNDKTFQQALKRLSENTMAR